MAGSREGQKKTGPCRHCGVAESPMWRNGPENKPILCNACGARWLTHRTLEGYLPKSAGSAKREVRRDAPKGGIVKTKAPAKAKPAKPRGCRYAGPGGEAAIGRLLWIWWGAPYNKYYEGVVIKFDRKANLHLIAFKDGDVLWYRLADEIVKDNGKKASAKVAPRKTKQAARPSPSASASTKPSPYKGPRGEGAVGRSIGIWFGGNQKFYYGEIMIYMDDNEGKTHLILYDDGDEGEWIDLDKELVDDFTSREAETSNTRQPPPPAPRTQAPAPAPAPGSLRKEDRLVLIAPRREILPSPSSSVPCSTPLASQLAKAQGELRGKLVGLKGFFDEGLITQKDYDSAKEKLLSSFIS